MKSSLGYLRTDISQDQYGHDNDATHRSCSGKRDMVPEFTGYSPKQSLPCVNRNPFLSIK